MMSLSDLAPGCTRQNSAEENYRLTLNLRDGTGELFVARSNEPSPARIGCCLRCSSAVRHYDDYDPLNNCPEVEPSAGWPRIKQTGSVPAELFMSAATFPVPPGRRPACSTSFCRKSHQHSDTGRSAECDHSPASPGLKGTNATAKLFTDFHISC